MEANPKISIITVCKNSAGTIYKCIESVVNQTYPNIEYIIIDGVSSDDTLNVIQNFSDKVTKLISEPDNGIFDAMNKGLSVSTGEYIIFLNADDFFISKNTISYTVNFILNEARSQYDIYYGKVLIFNHQTGIGNIWNAAKISRFSLFRASLPHPATIYKKDAFERYGVFNTTYKIASDYEWFVRSLLKYRLNFKRIDLIITIFSKGGLSTQKDNSGLIKKEKERVRKTYYSFFERIYYSSRWFIKKNLF
jgi:glycosyltransferase involved in cell wall biosynthesis